MYSASASKTVQSCQISASDVSIGASSKIFMFHDFCIVFVLKMHCKILRCEGFEMKTPAVTYIRIVHTQKNIAFLIVRPRYIALISECVIMK